MCLDMLYEIFKEVKILKFLILYICFLIQGNRLFVLLDLVNEMIFEYVYNMELLKVINRQICCCCCYYV